MFSLTLFSPVLDENANATDLLSPLDSVAPVTLPRHESEEFDCKTMDVLDQPAPDCVGSGLEFVLRKKVLAYIELMNLYRTQPEKQNFSEFIICVNRSLFGLGVGFNLSQGIFKFQNQMALALISPRSSLVNYLLPIIEEAKNRYGIYSLGLMIEILQFLQEKNPQLSFANRLVVTCFIDSAQWGQNRRWRKEMSLEFAYRVADIIGAISIQIAGKLPLYAEPAKESIHTIQNLFSAKEVLMKNKVKDLIQTLHPKWAVKNPIKVVQLVNEYLEFFKDKVLTSLKSDDSELGLTIRASKIIIGH